jgi:hypothetical protein
VDLIGSRYLLKCPVIKFLSKLLSINGSSVTAHLKHSTLFHYGADQVTQDLPAWFGYYNGRQIIEAGIKEGKQVFYLHKIKVRSEPASFFRNASCFLPLISFVGLPTG